MSWILWVLIFSFWSATIVAIGAIAGQLHFLALVIRDRRHAE